MSRAIKFRVWDGEAMRYVSSIKYHPEDRGGGIATVWSGARSIEKGYHLLQFTGLLDADGREVYEGDVLEWSDGYPRTTRSKVVFKGGAFVTRVYAALRPIAPFDSGGATTYRPRVIGNVYEDPGLLA